ncbi:putative retrotransposon-like family member retr-1-like protein, partial [Aphis craccivora]
MVTIFTKINTKKLIQPTKVKLESYSGYKLTPKGIIILECKVKEIVKDVQFVIIEHPKCIPILGLSSCIDFNLVQRIHRLHISKTKTAELDNFISKNKDVFEGLGTFPDLVQIKLVDEAVPKANPPRRVPLALKRRLEQTLKELEKSNKTLRICLDPSNLNKYIVREYFPIPTLAKITPKLINKSIFCMFDLKDGFHQIKLEKES